MSRSGLSTFRIIGSIVLSLACLETASGQPAQRPDLSGGEGAYWSRERGGRPVPVPGSPPPVRQDPGHPFTPGQGRTYQIGDLTNPNLMPWAKEVMRKDTVAIDSGKFVGYVNDTGTWVPFQPETACVPQGVPFMFLTAGGFRILQMPKEVLIIKGSGGDTQHVYLDVPHSANPKPSWLGESVGHYEGDTLVVDTIGFNTKTVLDAFRTPHTDKLHVVERLRTVDGGKGLEVTITVDDSGTFYQPFSTRIRAQRQQESWDEFICAESNENFGLFDFHMPMETKTDF
jgi:hypothetical protein